MLRFLACLVFVTVFSACGGRNQARPVAQARTLEVVTAPGIALEVIDWGGRGRPLVFLAGMGHTARVFEEFAPLFTRDFHVLGISRRGSGASSDVPPERFDELVDDVVAVLDSLDLRSAVLVGHSFAGLEMARFGEKYPDRCAGLIYLDAAYDYTDPELGRLVQATPPPQAPPMQSADSASVGTVRAYFERRSGFRLPESEIRATNRFAADGRLAGRVPSSARRRIVALQQAPHWDAVDCPAIGIYPVPTPPKSWLPYYAELDSAEREAAAAYFHAFSRWTAASRARFGRFPQNRVVEFPSSNHYFFLEKPEEASRIMQDFLSQLH